MVEWMAFSVDDYVSNTMHLSTRQHGGYILLICAAWKAKGRLPGNDAALMTITRLAAPEWKVDGPVLKEFLTWRGDHWVQERVEYEWQDAQSMIDAKSKAGRIGARKRWQGRNGAIANGSGDGNDIADASHTHRQTDAPLPLPLQEPIHESKKSAAASSSVPRAKPKRQRSSKAVARAAPPPELPPTPPPAEPDQTPPAVEAVDLSEERKAFNAWNQCAHAQGWPQAQFLNSTVRYQLQACLALVDGMPGWMSALMEASGAEFFREADGKPKGWFRLDWLLKQDNFRKLMEGAYAKRFPTAVNPPVSFLDTARNLAEAANRDPQFAREAGASDYAAELRREGGG